MALRPNKIGQGSASAIRRLYDAGLQSQEPQEPRGRRSAVAEGSRASVERLASLGLPMAPEPTPRPKPEPRPVPQVTGPMSQRINLNVAPGVYRFGTPLASRGRWYDSNLVRWSDGVMGAIGGWQAVTPRSFTGSGSDGQLDIGPACNGSHAWSARDGSYRIALGAGTSLKLIYGNTMDDLVISGGNINVPNYGPRSRATMSMDNFGGDLVVVGWDGVLNYINTADAVQTATPVSSLSGATGVPANNTAVVVTPERFIVALGAGGDNNKVHWCSQADPADWDIASITNTAGDLDLPTQGNIMDGHRFRGETLIWTDTDLISLRYHPRFVYGATVVGRGGAVSRRSMIVSGSSAYWMGRNNFWVYTGNVNRLPCPVADHVFDDLNRDYQHRVWAEKRDWHSEITWHYPGGSSVYCDKYVTYNYDQNIWYFGSMGRSGGVDAGVLDYPLLVDNDGRLWWHERGDDHGSLTPSAETGIIDIEDGKRLMFIDEIHPDDATTEGLSYTLEGYDEPDGTATTHGPYEADGKQDVRVTARHVRLKVEQHASGWRYGIPRIEARPAGER